MLFDLSLNTNKEDKQPTINYRLFLAPLSDVELEKFPKSSQATIFENPLREGRAFYFIDSRQGTINPTTSVGKSPLTGKLSIPIVLEGLNEKTLFWIYDNLDERVVAVWERCSDKKRFLAGSPCSGGLAIKFNKIGTLDNGNQGISFTLEGGDCYEPFWFYKGELKVNKIQDAIYDFSQVNNQKLELYNFDTKKIIHNFKVIKK